MAWPPKIGAVRKQPGETLVVLFGDSITQGGMSHNYVALLVQRMGPVGYRVLNAGIGGDTAYNLLQRMGPVVTAQPDAVVILVGTNDVQTHLRGGHMSRIQQWKKQLPQAMTREWYRSNVRQIVQTLQRTTSARVALCAIPVLGEDLDSRANETVRQFNTVLTMLADELKVAYLPLYETMDQFLRTQHPASGQAFDAVRSGELMRAALWDHTIRRRSWDAVSAHNGLVLTTDLVHFNGRGAAMIADLVEGWLRRGAEHAVPCWPDRFHGHV
jgi:lysophospholipase L1-like esterase